jgi:DsbC/DsbD-like thiol-disulfide interchange protein/cytochrome c biogenesis protein CcdA
MIRLLAFLLCLLLAAPAHGQAPGARNNIAATLVAGSEAPAPGQAVTIAISFVPQPGWHGYWLNPGDAGAPMRVAWRLPPGVQVDAFRYPVPQRLTIAGLMNYVFEGPHATLATLRVPADAPRGAALPLRARIDYLACTDQICVPEQADLALDLRVGDGSIAAETRAQFDTWRAALPRPLSATGTFERQGSRLRFAIPIPADAAVDDPYLFPVSRDVLAYAAPQLVSRNGDAIIVETDAHALAGNPSAFDGLLAVGGGRGFLFAAQPGPVPPAGEPIGAEAGAGLAAMLSAFLGAILGGLILNVMPCVFPILSLKALSLARAGESEAKARREALSYAAGVTLTCLALGALLLGLRSAGVAAGWAFQLQEPRFVLFLLLLVTAVALSLAGLFRFPGLSVSSGGRLGAFGSGVLAAFVATPCTGPFMAAALGAALVLPAAGALAVFGGLGLGLALPFLLLGFVPALRRRLPRPGPWMERLQRLLSVPMFLTALGLAWVLGRQTGVDGMTLGLAGALAAGFALWWLGARGATPQRWAALALLVAAFAVPLLALGAARPAQGAAPSALAAEPFSEARLAALRAERRPVFVYFTADWCLTCKVNERGALASPEVAERFRRAGVQVLAGDWTLGDAAISRFLERHGRSGVPLYLYYPAGGEAQILPQLLTSGDLLTLPG